jgi:hypothetical protein
MDAAVDWITPRHVTGAARFWRDRDALHLVSEHVCYHRMASFVVGDGLASRGCDRLFGANAHIRILCFDGGLAILNLRANAKGSSLSR